MAADKENNDASNHQHSHDHHGHGVDGHTFLTDEAVTALEWDAETFSGFIDQAIATIKAEAPANGENISSIVDVGCGPGIATLNLAGSFPNAQILAVDVSEVALDRTAKWAAAAGLSSRVNTRLVDIDQDAAAIGSAYVVLASMTLHHVDDEVTTLRQLHSQISPHGLLCVLERHEPATINLEDDLGKPGLWSRINEARLKRDYEKRSELPGGANADRYPTMLAEAGFTLILEEVLTETAALETSIAATKFIARQLTRIVDELAEYVDATDLAAVSQLSAEMTEAPQPRWAGTVSASRKMFLAMPAPSA